MQGYTSQDLINFDHPQHTVVQANTLKSFAFLTKQYNVGQTNGMRLGNLITRLKISGDLVHCLLSAIDNNSSLMDALVNVASDEQIYKFLRKQFPNEYREWYNQNSNHKSKIVPLLQAL